MISLLICLLTAHQPQQDTLRERLLIVVEDWNVKTSHTMLFDYLQDKFDVEVTTDEDISLRFNSEKLAPEKVKSFIDSHDEYAYDHVMILAPSIKNFGSVDTLLDFFDDGGNIFVGLDQTSKQMGRKLIKEFGAELFPVKSTVRGGADSSKFDVNIQSTSDYNSHNLAWSSNLFEPIKKTIVDLESPVAFKGTGMKLDVNNKYVFPILKGDHHTYATNPDHNKKDGTSTSFKVTGSDITLIAGYQSRYNHRLVVSGSTEVCSDDFISLSTPEGCDYRESSNWSLCKNMLDWNFQQKSVLKAVNLEHGLVDQSLIESGSQNSQEYKLKDYIHLSLEIYEKVNGNWVPFKTDDVQFEFIMLNPYWRIYLKNTEGARYETDFRAPDHNGVYKFLIDYNRYGYSRIHVEETAPVRVFRHDEFPRYLPSAFPYYTSVFTTMLGMIVFTVMFMHSENRQQQSKVKKD